MKIKIDIPGAINTALQACTKLGKFWTDKELPSDLNPSINFLLVIGLIPAVGFLVGGLILVLQIMSYLTFGLFFKIMILAPIFVYVLFVAAPIVLGFVLGAIDPALSINKGKAPEYAYILAIASSAAAVGVGIAAILVALIKVGWIGWIIGVIGYAATVFLAYLGLTESTKIEMANAIILLVVSSIVYLVLYALLFMPLGMSIFRGF